MNLFYNLELIQKINSLESFIKIIQEYTKSNVLLNSEISDDGKNIKNSYDVVMKEKKIKLN